MGISPLQYLQMQDRLGRANHALRQNRPDDKAAREVGHGGLHEKIMAWCDAQWPRWKYIHSRTDKRSTIAVGAADFTIFCPEGRVLCMECKAPGRKRTQEQNAWALEMAKLGHIVYLITTMQEFLALTVEARITQEPMAHPTTPKHEPPCCTTPACDCHKEHR